MTRENVETAFIFAEVWFGFMFAMLWWEWHRTRHDVVRPKRHGDRSISTHKRS